MVLWVFMETEEVADGFGDFIGKLSGERSGARDLLTGITPATDDQFADMERLHAGGG